MTTEEQKAVLDAFLSNHGIAMRESARLSHYGRRFRAVFPEIADSVHPTGPWTKGAVLELARHVAGLDVTRQDQSINRYRGRTFG